ncbi:MAG: chemotaxis protein CheV [candidate division Zixibacteria bacterium]|nr:chemotaxis protein CheV [candidate division Zixibacteria bacterium]
MTLDAESYLQSGSNELRILEYAIDGQSFGINILKVQKIVAQPECLTSTMNTHPSIKGIFKDNDIIIPLIDLGGFLGLENKEDNSAKKVVVTEFFGHLNGFLVDSVKWIHHFHWENVINANDILKTIKQKYVISIVKPDGERMVPLLDYETIILELCPNLGTQEMEKTANTKYDARGMKILIAEDSPAVRNMLASELAELGFEADTAHDGKEALEMLTKDKSYKLVISDIEMPQMDGLALTCAIRNDTELKNIPVIVYSSIGDIGMKARAEFLNADAHVTKLNIDELLENVIRLTENGKGEAKTSSEEKAIESETTVSMEAKAEPAAVAESQTAITNKRETIVQTGGENIAEPFNKMENILNEVETSMKGIIKQIDKDTDNKAIENTAPEDNQKTAYNKETNVGKDKLKPNAGTESKAEIIMNAETVTINTPHKVTINDADNVEVNNSLKEAVEEDK